MRKSIAAKNACLQAYGSLFDSGALRLYAGTMPASPEDQPSGNLVREHKFKTPAFKSAVMGSIEAHKLSNGIVLTSETPTWAGAVRMDGSTIYDAQLVGMVPNTPGETVSCERFTLFE